MHSWSCGPKKDNPSSTTSATSPTQLVSPPHFFSVSLERPVHHQSIDWSSTLSLPRRLSLIFQKWSRMVLSLRVSTLKVPNGTLRSSAWWSLKLWSSLAQCLWFTSSLSPSVKSPHQASTCAHATTTLSDRVVLVVTHSWLMLISRPANRTQISGWSVAQLCSCLQQTDYLKIWAQYLFSGLYTTQVCSILLKTSESNNE